MAAQQLLTAAEFKAQTIAADVYAGLDDPTIETACLWASGVAASYLRKRLIFPLVSWGEELKHYVGELVQWKLFGRRGVRPGSGNNEIARMRYEDAIKWLESVSRGLVEIDCVDGSPTIDEEGAQTDSRPSSNWSVTTGRRDCDE